MSFLLFFMIVQYGKFGDRQGASFIPLKDVASKATDYNYGARKRKVQGNSAKRGRRHQTWQERLQRKRQRAQLILENHDQNTTSYENAISIMKNVKCVIFEPKQITLFSYIHVAALEKDIWDYEELLVKNRVSYCKRYQCNVCYAT